MISAEFEEKSYEGPLYNQLERGNQFIFTPGQVLENTLGFDRGIFLAQTALWQTLGYKSHPYGAALAYYDWPLGFGPGQPRTQLPRFRLNLFLQAKRPVCYSRKPRSLKAVTEFSAPVWSFRTTAHQQHLLDVLADTLGSRVHVAYAAPAFHTNSALFTHTQRRTVVENSTFPSAQLLSGHGAWYYNQPGAHGAVNPEPEKVEEPPLLERVFTLARETAPSDAGDISWLDRTAGGVITSLVKTSEGVRVDSVIAHFFNDLQTLERFAEAYELTPSLHSYAQVALFTIRFDLSWFVVA